MWKKLFGDIIRIGLPMSASQIAQFSFLMVMFFYAGHIGVHELGGVSIAVGILNATGFAFSTGLCGALETLLSHSYGRDPQDSIYGVYAQRMFLILMLFCIPLALLLGFVEPILIAMGEPLMVASYVGEFCWISLLGLPPIMFLELLRRYYVCQHLSYPFFVMLVIAALLNPLIEYLLVEVLGYNGIAVGWVFLTIGMDVALLAYLWCSGSYRRTWNGWSKAALQNWRPMLKLAIPSLGMALGEWTAMEVNSVCSGFLRPEDLGAYAISSQVTNLCWSITSGFFMASTVLVGNSIGEGDTHTARCYALLSSVIVLIVSLFNILVVYLYSKEIAYIFTEDTEVVSVFVAMSPYFLAYHVVDALQSNFLGIMRGCGLNLAGLIIISMSLTIVGMPFGLYLLFYHHLGVAMLWIGPFLGCTFVGIPVYLFVLFYKLDWKGLLPHSEARGEMYNIIIPGLKTW